MNFITMREFTRWGRFANQIFQYAFLRTYALKWECELQLPPWVGNVLFGAADPPITVNLPSVVEHTNHLEQAEPPEGDEYVNHDFRGYGQYHTSYYRPHREFLRDVFLPTEPVRRRMKGPVEDLKRRGRTLIGIHLRRGDYGRLIFYVTPVRWYLAWLAENWKKWIDPVLFIATESPELVDEFAEYHPVTATNLGVELSTIPMEHYPYLRADLWTKEPWQIDFFPDWWLLSQCDVILAPNSTYSVTAAMMGGPQEFWRSSLPKQTFIQEDPWNMCPLQHDRAEQFKHVEGVCLDETPYWKRLSWRRFEEK